MIKQKETLDISNAHEIESKQKRIQELFGATFNGEPCVIVGETTTGESVVEFANKSEENLLSTQPFAVKETVGIDAETYEPTEGAWFIPVATDTQGRYELPTLTEAEVLIPAGSPELN
jgi:hypothetical protein